jgi:hypothetical protein
MSDLIKRLRDVTGFVRFETGDRVRASACLSEEAADILEAKDAEIARLRKALVWMRENPYAHQSHIASVARTALAEGENNE